MKYNVKVSFDDSSVKGWVNEVIKEEKEKSAYKGSKFCFFMSLGVVLLCLALSLVLYYRTFILEDLGATIQLMGSALGLFGVALGVVGAGVSYNFMAPVSKIEDRFLNVVFYNSIMVEAMRLVSDYNANAKACYAFKYCSIIDVRLRNDSMVYIFKDSRHDYNLGVIPIIVAEDADKQDKVIEVTDKGVIVHGYPVKKIRIVRK